MRLLLMRHAATRGNSQGRMLGQVDELLSPHGIWQAQLLGQKLSQQLRAPTHLYSSPLRRAVMTLDILMASYADGEDSLPMQTDDALLEIHNGIFQGLTWQEAVEQYPQLCQQLISTQVWIPIPGSETLVSCCDRSQQFIQTLVQTHNNTDRIWIMTHGGILQYLIAAILNTPQIWGIQINNTAMFEFEIDLTPHSQAPYPPQQYQILRFNDRPHLPPERCTPSDDQPDPD